ncbi:hypothetical protein Fcan01_20298 [Folsomia candida]|uniref:C2H2-type domain-containing protein n=1 Tax=Folsomia candida TaxID=158441 RepID=A0A226DJX9_FOLCA|nr:hypothetical protein Fcan01_20298 [Folsomia candida]
MKALKFEAMHITIWRPGWKCEKGQQIVKLVERFSQDFSTFINQPDFHPIKILTINADYLTPISTLLTKFCPSLEEVNIQFNKVWIKDEQILDKSGFPDDLMFPKLKKLTLNFSQDSRIVDDDLEISDSKSFHKLVQASNGIEELVLKNYVKLPCDLNSFKNLRKITIYGRKEYVMTLLKLHDCLTQFVALPTGQLRSFKLVYDDIGVQRRSETPLLCFLQQQRQSLENLTLSFTFRSLDLNSCLYLQGIVLPRCMPSLKKLWISLEDERAGTDSSHGFKLASQLAKEAGDFEVVADRSKAPCVLREGEECGLESCPGCNNSLVYGREKEADNSLRNLAERVTALESVVQQLVTRIELLKGENPFYEGIQVEYNNDGDTNNANHPPIIVRNVNNRVPLETKRPGVAKKSTSGVPKNLLGDDKNHAGNFSSGLLSDVKEDAEFEDIQVKFEPLDFVINPEEDRISANGVLLFEDIGQNSDNLGDEDGDLTLFNPGEVKSSPLNNVDDSDYTPQEDDLSEEESGSESSYNLRKNKKNKIRPKNKTVISIMPTSQPEVTLPNPFIRLGPALSTPEELASHNANVTQIMKQTPKKGKIRKRIKKPPGVGFKFKCDHCSYGSNFKRKYLQHYHRHTGERPYLCATCGKGFRGYDLVKSHEKSCTNRTKSHSCPVEGCSEAFKLQSSLQRHINKMHKDSRRQCEVCRAIYSGPDSLYIHKKRMHQDRPFTCPICSHKFVFAHELKTHVELHSDPKHTFRSRKWRVGPPEEVQAAASPEPLDTDKIYVVPPTFVCSKDGCGKSYRREVLLQRHVRARHWTEEERKVGCDVCGRIVKDHNHLKSHMKIVHSEERAHVCAICGQAFKMASHMIRHERGHANPNWKPRSNCKPKKYKKEAN